MGNLGWSEMFFIVVFALIIFGPRRLPDIAKTLGRTMAQLRRASEDFKQTWEAEVERAEIKDIQQQINSAVDEPSDPALATAADGTDATDNVDNTDKTDDKNSIAGIIGLSGINSVSDNQIQISAAPETVAKSVASATDVKS
jgi:Tat protein translocase TatB subunit